MLAKWTLPCRVESKNHQNLYSGDVGLFELLAMAPVRLVPWAQGSLVLRAQGPLYGCNCEHSDLSAPKSRQPLRLSAAIFTAPQNQLRPERGGTQGAKPGSGVQRFWGPLGASEFDPSFQQFGVSETPSQGSLRAPERLSGPRGRFFRGLGEVCSFSTEWENKEGHSEAPKRSHFPGCPLRGFQPSGSYPRATTKNHNLLAS